VAAASLHRQSIGDKKGEQHIFLGGIDIKAGVLERLLAGRGGQ